MSFFEILILALGLSADAFGVSVCIGLQANEIKGIKKYLIPSLYFGAFQGLMPVIGYFAGVKFQHLISNFGHWIAFIILFLIGINMIRESALNKDCTLKADLSPQNMLSLALATSIDAFIVGVGFAFLKADILINALIIGVVTFVTSIIGVKIGIVFGAKYKTLAEVLGGVILILIAFKILIEHLFS